MLSPRSAAFLAILLFATDAAAQTRYACTEERARNGNHTILTSTDDGKGRPDKTEHINQRPGYCLHTVFIGDVELADDLSDIVSVPSGGRAVVHEITGSRERRLELVRGGSGLERRYLENGRTAEYDAEARRWLERTLVELVRSSGFDAKRRIARLRAQEGVGAVLREITQLPGDGVRRVYYSALLAGSPRLTVDEHSRALRQAVHDIDSDGDLRLVLTSATQQGYRLPPMVISAAIHKMESDGDRRLVLTTVLRDADRESLLAALRALPKLDSDGDKSMVLVQAAPRAMTSDDTSIRDAFFTAARTVESDGDLRRVLTAALRASTRPPVVANVIATSQDIESDGDKSAVLVSVARLGVVQQSSTLRDAYLRVARTIESPGDYRRAVDPMVP